MPKSSRKITLSSSRDIPFNQLSIAQSNVRRIKAGISIEQLAEDIARRTLLQSITVRPVRDSDGNETGMFEIPAGGRRYRALELLVKQKRLAKDAPIPCVVREGGLAEEDSLAENIQRAPLHPLDQFRAFLAFREKGMSEEEIAANQFVSVSVVKQRLRLAAVSPKLLDIYAEDGISLDQLMAFTVNGDHERQEQVFERLTQSYSREPHMIRRMLTEGAVRAADKRARFVGQDAYEEAGGTVMRDLFQGDDGGWLQDVGLLDMLVADKLREESAAIAAEGWKWVEVAPDFPYGHTYGLRQIRGEQPELSEAETASRLDLQGELDDLEKRYAEADELPDEVDERLGEIEAALSALNHRPMVFDSDELSRAGAFVSIDAAGNLRVERGYVRPEDEVPVHQHLSDAGETEGTAEDASLNDDADRQIQGAHDIDEPEDEGLKPIPDRLMSELTAHRTLALRHALGEAPEVAFLAGLHALALRAFYYHGSDSCLDIELKSVGFGAQAPGLNDSPLATAFADRHQRWAASLPKEPEDLWATLAALEDDRRRSLFAHCVSLSVNAIYEAYNRRPRALAHADKVAQAVDLDMVAAGWRPTVDSFFGRVTKARILASVREAKGDRAGDRIEHLKKAEMAEKAEELLDQSGWLPEPLRTPGRAAANAEPGFDFGEGDVAETAAEYGESAMAEIDPDTEDEPAELEPHAIAAE